MITDNIDNIDKLTGDLVNNAAIMIKKLRSELKMANEDLIKARYLLHAMFDEHCWVNPLLGDKPIYDTANNHVHEEVQDYLIKVGLIQSEECTKNDETEGDEYAKK